MVEAEGDTEWWISGTRGAGEDGLADVEKAAAAIVVVTYFR